MCLILPLSATVTVVWSNRKWKTYLCVNQSQICLSPSSTFFPASTSVWIPPENFKGFLCPRSRPLAKQLPDSVLRPPQKCRASNHQTWTVSVGEPYAQGRGGLGAQVLQSFILCLWVYSTRRHTHTHTHKHTHSLSLTHILTLIHKHTHKHFTVCPENCIKILQ